MNNRINAGFTYLGAFFFLILLGVLMVAGDGYIFYTEPNHLYCVNASGSTTNNCTNSSTLNVNKTSINSCNHITEIHGFAGEEIIINISNYPGGEYRVDLC